MRRCPPKNVSDKDRFPAYLPPELESRIRLSDEHSVEECAGQIIDYLERYGKIEPL